MLDLTQYSNESFQLTKREQGFIKIFLSENDCGARTPEELLGDNFSCQCLEDMNDTFTGLSKNQIGGFLSSLQEKSVIYMEERHPSEGPNLYWVNDSYLESLDTEVDFYENEGTEELRKEFF